MQELNGKQSEYDIFAEKLEPTNLLLVGVSYNRQIIQQMHIQ